MPVDRLLSFPVSQQHDSLPKEGNDYPIAAVAFTCKQGDM